METPLINLCRDFDRDIPELDQDQLPTKEELEWQVSIALTSCLA